MKRRLIWFLTIISVMTMVMSGSKKNPATCGFLENKIYADEEKISEPGLIKYIVTADGEQVNRYSFSAGDEIQFKLESNLPEDLLEFLDQGYYNLSFCDIMDEVFELDVDSIVVKIGDKELEQVDYELSLSLGGGGDTSFTVRLDLVELFINDTYFGISDLGRTKITVDYTAILTEEVNPGSYENTAWVEYENGRTPGSTVLIDTYGIIIIKHKRDDKDSRLEGAVFDLYRLIDGQQVLIAEDMVSDADGVIRINGLAAGTYILMETKAPEGYVIDSRPLTIELGDEKGEIIVTVYFPNIPRGTPVTGTASLTGIGLTMIFLGLFSLCISIKKVAFRYE